MNLEIQEGKELDFLQHIFTRYLSGYLSDENRDIVRGWNSQLKWHRDKVRLGAIKDNTT